MEGHSHGIIVTPMDRLDHSAWQTMRDSAEVITRDQHGEKVLRRPDGTMLKLFRRKRLISSAAIRPYAARFARAAERLAKLGIPTIRVLGYWRVPSIERDVVQYVPLPGLTLRDAGENGRLEALGDYAALLAHLHDKGVFFRAAHFGNIIVTPDRSLGLIDVSEARFFVRPLPVRHRARNFRHIIRYAEDRQLLRTFGADAFLDRYMATAALSDRAKDRLRGRIAQWRSFFRDAAEETVRDA